MFCSNCGSEATGKFCLICGAALGVPSSNTPVQQSIQPTSISEETVLWVGKPSGLADKAKTAAHVNSVSYKVTNQRIIIDRGLLSKKQEELELSRIKDYVVKQSIAEKLMKIGSITIVSSDSTAPNLVLENIENPLDIKELIRKAAMEYLKTMNVNFRQNL